MKTKLYIGIIAAIMAASFKTEGQTAVARSYENNNSDIVINNYYNYDFHYSSRINRFHRSYVAFDYYSPVFTDVYWYSYQPYTWGLTIYGGGRLGIGVTYNYPIYYSYWDYPWYDGWDYAWYGESYWWRYDPFYVHWYSPIVINVRIGNWWPGHFYGYNIRYHGFGNYRPVYNTYNYYYYNTPVRANETSANYSRRTTPSVITTHPVHTDNRSDLPQSATQNRRVGPGTSIGNQSDRIHQGDQGNNNSLNPGNTNNVNRGVNSGNNPGRRGIPQNNSNNVHQGDQGNNNSLNPGNTNNVNRGVNSGNNPGRRNEIPQVNRNQGNAASSQVVTVPSNNNSDRRSISMPAASSSRSRINTTVGSGRSSSSSTERTSTQTNRSTVQRYSVTSTRRPTSIISPGNSANVPKSGTRVSTIKSSSKSESNKKNSENNSGTRRR